MRRAAGQAREQVCAPIPEALSVFGKRHDDLPAKARLGAVFGMLGRTAFCVAPICFRRWEA